MSSVLVVWIEGVRVGHLATRDGMWSFQYDPGWLAHPRGYPLSPHLPLRPNLIADNAEDRRVQWFFDNLLPEGGIRTLLARHARLDEHDAFGLLGRFGEESAGALTLLPEGQPFSDGGHYDPLTPPALRQLLHDLPSVPLIAAGGQARMSLAGAQHKLGLHQVDGDDRFLLPKGAASSVIVKPDNARPELFPYCPANEHFCMTLAGRVGLEVPKTWLHHLPEPLFVVKRFDRVISETQVRRLHQIDLCQLLNKWAGYKYESAGGIGITEAFRALDATHQPAVSRNQFVRWVLFNYLIGNSDAHAKNVALIVAPDGIRLAPAYDLLSVAAYGSDYDYMAMTIAGEVRYGWVEREHWRKLASVLGVGSAFLVRVARQLAKTVPARARELHEDPAFTPDERDFLETVLGVIDKHTGYLDAAIKT